MGGIKIKENRLKNASFSNHKTRTLAATALITTLLLSASLIVIPAVSAIKPGVDFEGPHFNLNIHGLPAGVDKFEDDTIGSGRHSIFAPISILDAEGNPTTSITINYAFSYTQDWTVPDCDATIDGTASIILPAYISIDTNGDGIDDTTKRVSYYNVYLVGLGKPSDTSQVVIEPDAAYDASWTAYQLNQEKLEVAGHRKGPPVWYDGTQLFFADVTVFDGITYTDYIDQWIFDIPGLEGYWWQMTNNDVKLMQIRFYPVFR